MGDGFPPQHIAFVTTLQATPAPSDARTPARPGKPPASPILLATDLDGTFLAGTPTLRRQLYRLVELHPDIRLAWVTGRGVESVLPLLADPSLPTPEFLICDVGATVLFASGMQPIQPLQSRIEARWPGELAVERAMARFDLVRQRVPQQRRCSYECDPDRLEMLRPEIERVAAELGCDVLYSASHYLDILPKDTNKGSSLRALVTQLGLDDGRVLVAGDTLNDLALFGQGFRGVCVHGSEPRLLQAVSDRREVLSARSPGCDGILEALGHFSLLESASVAEFAPPNQPLGRADLVMVYHRLPFEEDVVEGRRVRRQHSSPNGIIPSLLSFFADGRVGSWVAWSTVASADHEAGRRSMVDAERYPGLTAARVPLSEEDVETFYKRFSKEAFWPVINGFWERAHFDEEDWQTFKRVNRLFAEATAAEAAFGATVWLHDYNLWLVPPTLRELRPDLKIAFFHHTQFPAGDIFNIIPWRREILGGLMACDYIGFQVPRHAENFVDTLRASVPFEVVSRASCAPRFLTFGCAMGVQTRVTENTLAEGRVRIGAHPIGTDVDRIRECLESPDVLESTAEIRDQLAGKKLVLSIERLDYGKGILEKLAAFERLLEENEDQLGKVTLVLVCVPAAREMVVYRVLQTQIEQAVGRINGRYSRLDWTPVRFFARGLGFEEVVAHYAAADVMWVTPLRDGMNLVAKEFVATQGVCGNDGVLLLSEFAGAAAELQGALLTNPHDARDMVESLRLALLMPAEERADRLRTMFEIVSHFDLARWGSDFLAAVEDLGLDTPATPTD
jgi:glucosylglycerol-phosphate synthase